MSSTVQASKPDSGPRRGLPRWAWVLIGLLTVIAIVSAAIAVFASRGRQVVVLPPEPAPPAASAATPSPSASTSAAPVTLADGCLGGATDSDRAVLTAQRDAPLTQAGAASFTATLVRWAFAVPPPPFQKVTAEQVLAPGATAAAQRSLSSAKQITDGSTATFSFANGRYYVEAFDGRSAIVSYVADARVTADGRPLQGAAIGGSIHLEAVNGVWRYQDRSAERAIEDIQRVGQPYSGGC